MPLRIDTSDGASTVLSDDTLLVWLDETGDDTMADPGHPIFGLGGCVIEARHYQFRIQQRWTELKRRQFKGATALHASGLRNPSGQQLDALGRFFHRGKFARIAALVSSHTEISEQLAPYEACANALLKRLSAVTRTMLYSDVALIMEASHRGDRLARRYLSKICVHRTYRDGHQMEVPMYHFFLPKSLNEPGLEIADFIMHAAGIEARARQRTGHPRFGKDFRATFLPRRADLASFLYATRIGSLDVSTRGE